MAKTSATPGWQLALLILTSTVVGVVVVTCLYWARTVFIPVALAVFLTVLLAPLESIHTIVTDRQTPQAFLEAVRVRGLHVVLS